MKKLIYLFVALMAFVSCGDDDELPTTGTIVNGIDMSLLPGAYEFNGNIAPSFILRKDGTCTIISSSSGNEVDDKWSYEKSNCVLLVGSHVYTVKLLTEDALAAEWTSVKYETSLSSWKRYYLNVEKIELSASSIDLIVGSQDTLKAILTPSNVYNPSVKWSSSDESVVTVSNTGIVKAIGDGNATITCTSVNNSDVKAACKVSVGKIPVTKITLSQASLEVDKGSEKRIIPTVFPSNATYKSVVWSSSNNSVATVNDAGYIYGKSEGKATITCSAKDNSSVKATCEVTVKYIPVSEIKLSPTALDMKVSDNQKINVTILPSDATDKTLIWSSSNKSVAIVDENGNVTAKAKGETTITCIAKDNSSVKATCEVTVKNIPVTEITLSTTSWNMEINEKMKLSATVFPSNATDKTLIWSSSNESVAIVDENGNVTANVKGKATITCVAKDDSRVKATCEVTVIIPFEETAKINGHGYVDLGLPSGTKWATCNVGASSPEFGGDYFAWGETKTKSRYGWDAYGFSNGSFVTKYCTNSAYGSVDNKTELELKNDAASVNWGGTWRMPSSVQIHELKNTSNCTWTWTSINGHAGYKVKSKHNGKSIFLPATKVNNAWNGSYWTRSLYTSNNRSAYGLSINSSSATVDNDNRGNGRFVRAISE